MDIMDLASSGIAKITSAFGRRVQRTVLTETIDRNPPVTLTGDAWRIGFGRAKIMPPLSSDKTYYIAGHGSGHVMEGVLTDVYTRAVWVDCGGDGIVWISADIVGLTNTEVEIIRKRIRASRMLKGVADVHVSCTHSHSGVDTVGYWGKPNAVSIPSDGKDPEYMELLYAQCVSAAEAAFQDRRPGALYAGTAPITDLLLSKRKFSDRHEVLSRLRFVPADGTPETWMINVGAHPNSLGGDNRMLSGEYPYYLSERVYAKTGARVHFGVGPIGGMDAERLTPDDPRRCIKEQGEAFADAAIGITEETELEPRLRFLRRPFYLPVDNAVLLLLAMRGTMSFHAYPCKTSATGVMMKTEMTYLSFGGKKILFLPGENFVPTVYGGYLSAAESPTGVGPEINPEPLASIAGDPDLTVYGVTNDMTGYVIPPNDFVLHPTQPYLNTTRDRFDDNHYHETNSMGPQSQKIIADAFRAVAEDFGE